ncbi:hypothetical protein TNCV_4332991 [Trichonephila clavipes]|nr:hypothetical protein TNCV_4332991 [Trichonephila clavipes]
MPTSAIKDLLKKWADVRAMVLEWHPNQSDFSRVRCGHGSLVVKVSDRGWRGGASPGVVLVDHWPKLRGPSPKALEKLNSATLIFTYSLYR